MINVSVEFWSEVQRVSENRICTSLPSSLRIAWNGVAFSRREIGSEDDVLDFFVGHFVDVDLTRQPSSKLAIGVFDSALLPGGGPAAQIDRA
jgi:hypothetical protein